MDRYFDDIASGTTLPAVCVQQLLESGFMIMPGPFSMAQLHELSVAYDDAMSAGIEPDFRAGSTTTRLNDLVNHGSAFDPLYVHPPLLEACQHLIGKPFKLSSLLARTLRSGSGAQDLHVDLPSDSPDAPMLGFILMVDPFTPNNGATRFVPRSQGWLDAPSDRLDDPKSSFPGEVLACGPAGAMVVFDGIVWHGHTANGTSKPRRSIQGYFVRRNARSGTDFSSRIKPGTVGRIGPLARYLLTLDSSPIDV